MEQIMSEIDAFMLANKIVTPPPKPPVGLDEVEA